jgi:hypothetical protein
MAKGCDHEILSAFETHLKAEPLKIEWYAGLQV